MKNKEEIINNLNIKIKNYFENSAKKVDYEFKPIPSIAASKNTKLFDKTKEIAKLQATVPSVAPKEKRPQWVNQVKQIEGLYTVVMASFDKSKFNEKDFHNTLIDMDTTDLT